MREIRKITIVTNQGVKSLEIGDVVNGLEIASIKDKGIEYPDQIYFIYVCYDHLGQKVAETINAPIELEYWERHEEEAAHDR